MIFRSIRWRLQIWHSLILVLVMSGFAFAAYEAAWRNQLRAVDEELDFCLNYAMRPRPDMTSRREGPRERRENQGPWDPSTMIARLRETVRAGVLPDVTNSNLLYLVHWQDNESLPATSPLAPVIVPRPETASVPPNTVWPDGRSMSKGHSTSVSRSREELRERYRVLPMGDVLLAGRSLAPERAAMRQLLFRLGLAGAGILTLGLAGGWWLATRAIRPIQAISSTAGRIAAGDLSQRISTAGTDDELGRLAEVLNSTFARLEGSFAQQARFTSDASHELRTPLAVMLTQTQSTLARERSPEEYRATLEACQRAAQRMRAITESLLQLARLDSGQSERPFETLDLRRIAIESVQMLQPLAESLSVNVQLQTPSPVPCSGDPVQLGQVITNLVTNALQFNRPGGQVTVTLRATEKLAEVVVEDNGIGITPEDLPHIFERFYVADKARSGQQKRTGLGLSICRSIMHRHGGEIQVRSEPGKGSLFTVRLPLTNKGPASRESSATHPASADATATA